MKRQRVDDTRDDSNQIRHGEWDGNVLVWTVCTERPSPNRLRQMWGCTGLRTSNSKAAALQYLAHVSHGFRAFAYKECTSRNEVGFAVVSQCSIRRQYPRASVADIACRSLPNRHHHDESELHRELTCSSLGDALSKQRQRFSTLQHRLGGQVTVAEYEVRPKSHGGESCAPYPSITYDLYSTDSLSILLNQDVHHSCWLPVRFSQRQPWS